MRPPLKTLKRGVAYLAAHASGASERADDASFDLFELTLLSDRQLVFQQLERPFTCGAVHLSHVHAVQLVAHPAYTACVRLTLDTDATHLTHLEWYAETITELREWETLLTAVREDSATCHPAVQSRPSLAGWFVMLSSGGGEALPARRYVTTQTSARNETVLSCFDVAPSGNGAPELAQSSLVLSTAQRIRLLERGQTDALLRAVQTGSKQ